MIFSLKHDLILFQMVVVVYIVPAIRIKGLVLQDVM